jgi:hypothetical protein
MSELSVTIAGSKSERQMSRTFLVLFLLSAGTGFALRAFPWSFVVIPWTALALLSAAILHVEGFGAIAGIGSVTACLTLSQTVYLADHAKGVT